MMIRRAKQVIGRQLETAVSQLYYRGGYVSYEMYSGLANRLRHHCAAHAYAIMSGRKLVADWRRNENCYATFEDLFVPVIQPYSALPYAEKWLFRRALWHPEFKDCFVFDKNALSGGRSVEVLPIGLRQRVVYLPQELETYVEFCNRLGSYHQAVVTSLVPKPEILGEVDRFCSSIPFPRIGVHIRADDFPPEDSGLTPPFPGAYCPPISRFEIMIERIQKIFPTAHVILVSNAETEELASLTYKYKVHQRPITNRRDSLQGIQDALVDMLALASCDVILGTPYSSFNAFAAFWKSKPLVWARKEDWHLQLDQALNGLSARIDLHYNRVQS